MDIKKWLFFLAGGCPFGRAVLPHGPFDSFDLSGYEKSYFLSTRSMREVWHSFKIPTKNSTDLLSVVFRSAVSSAVHFFMLIARVVLRAFGTVFSKSLSITTLGVGAFVVRCSFRRSLSDHDSRLARLWFGASFRRSLSDHHSRLARLWFGAVLPLSVGAFVVRSVSERPSRSCCIAARCHAAMRRPGSDRNLPCVRSWSTSL